MVHRLRPFPSLFAWLRWRLRSSEAAFIVLTVAVGSVAGLLTVLQGAIARTIQHLFFGLPPDERLSGLVSLASWQLLLLPVGGAVLTGFSILTRARRRALVDAVEANALHGGNMSMGDSLVISGQTLLSNGFGASVGLEAAYAQLGGATASVAGRFLHLRRNDLRTLVGASTGAAIAAAFGAPLAGAFYAFEIVIGAYTPSAIAPVAAASLAGSLTAQGLGAAPYFVAIHPGAATRSLHYLFYVGLGAICAILGIFLMRAVAFVEARTRATLPNWSRPFLGGLLLIPVAWISPQTLSGGHGALHLDLAVGVPLAFILTVFAAKCVASVLSLGFGFRGGLFFASLFIGTLVGHIFADGLEWAAGHAVLDPTNSALVGMAALAVAIVGGPMTMSLLVLEVTHDFALTGAVIAASLVSSTIVREMFGYSFSTWRLHLRGETIKSARDVGWVKTLTAGRMMRRDAMETPASTTIGEFRRRFPLGSANRAVLTDEEGRYAGIVVISSAYVEGLKPEERIATIARLKDRALAPDMDIKTVMRVFDEAQTDALAVIDAGAHVLGVLSERFVRKRYAEEMEKAQRELFGE